jgi:hypothetical protein
MNRLVCSRRQLRVKSDYPDRSGLVFGKGMTADNAPGVPPSDLDRDGPFQRLNLSGGSKAAVSRY